MIGLRVLRGFRWVLRMAGALALLVVACKFLYTLRPLGPLPETAHHLREHAAQDWGLIADQGSGCVLVNNVWNRRGAGRGFQQEVFLAEAGASTILGWRWRAPWQLLAHVVSQPQIVCGDKPWDEPVGHFGGFPFQVGSRRLLVDLDARLRGTGTYNMAFTMWAVSALPVGREHISHEIMIWNANHGQSPAGQRACSIDVGGVPYDLYVEPGHGDASDASAQRWTYVAFVSRTPVLKGQLDLGVFLDHLLGLGLLSKKHLVTSLELGNEVCEGTGMAELRHFAVSIR
jgi:hypothetical protein